MQFQVAAKEARDLEWPQNRSLASVRSHTPQPRFSRTGSIMTSLSCAKGLTPDSATPATSILYYHQ